MSRGEKGLTKVSALLPEILPPDLFEGIIDPKDVGYMHPVFLQCFLPTRHTDKNRERWQTERVFDLGFNLAVAAGLVFVAIGAAGLAWSLGFLTVTIDVYALLDFAGREMGDAVLSQVQTIVMAAALLTMALGLWWWAEADSL